MAISDYCQMIVNSLKTHLEFAKEGLRKVQVSGFEKLINFVALGKLNGLVKHPTGAGKTRFFSEVLAAVNLPSLILVPRVNLVSDTRDSLVGEEMRDIEGVGYLDEEVILLSDENGTASSGLKNIYDKIAKMENFNGVVIMTYQSFQSISTSNQSLLDNFMKIIKVVISDEAHKALGDKTQESIKQYVDDIIGDEYERLHLHVTATPHLSQKDVRDVYDVDVIDWVRVQDSVEDGILIMPQFCHIGTASYRTTDDIYFSDKFFDELASSEKFVMNSGQSVTEAVVDEYIKLKDENDGYLPGVAFCATISHAQATKDYLESLGIRAIRCTSSNDKFDCGVTPNEAKQMFHDETVDVVVTVSKVGEGWDVPTLRCALWLKPVRSSSVFIQGTGRIMRTLLLNTTHAVKDSSNTFVIEPLWELVRIGDSKSKKEKEVAEEIIVTRNVSIDTNKESRVYLAKNGFEHFVASDEYDVDTLISRYAIDIPVRLDIDLHSDDHLRKLIGGIEELIVDGRGICLQKKIFVCKKHDWNITGCAIGRARFQKNSPGSIEAEIIAHQLWSNEAKKLLSVEKFDPRNDNHLRTLIGAPSRLIVNGKCISLQRQTFIYLDHWKVTGYVIIHAQFGKKSVGKVETEKLIRRLWPEEASILLFDPKSDHDLRSLIGGIEKLVVNDKGVDLGRKQFTCLERDWKISASVIGKARFGTKYPGSAESEDLAWQLWPEEAEKSLPRERFNPRNNDHLRKLIGGIGNLILKRKGKSFQGKRFTCLECNWDISAKIISTVLFGKKCFGSIEAEKLAWQLWPEEAKKILPKERFNPRSNIHLRKLIGKPENLIVDGIVIPLKQKTFICAECYWKVSGGVIGYAQFGKKSAGRVETEKLIRRLWPEETKKLLKK